MDEVAKVSGFANMRMKNIWGYGKHTGRMPVVIFDSVQRSRFGHDVQGFAEGVVLLSSDASPNKLTNSISLLDSHEYVSL